MYINELNPMKKIDKIINESIKDVVKDKVKKGINKYKDTFSYNEEDDAENPAAVDFKEVGKDAWKSAKNLVKKGAQKYKNAFSYNEEDDAENPAAIDFKEVGKGVKNWLKGKNKKSMKESKQIIRLTESDLHRVIKESVKQVLSELDYRTYLSAHKKALEQGDEDRASHFGVAARNAFNREYGYGLENIPYGDADDNGIFPEKATDVYAGAQVYTPDEQDDNAIGGASSFMTTSGKAKDKQRPNKNYTIQDIHITNDKSGKLKQGDSTGNFITKGFTLNPALKYKQMKGDKSVRDYLSGKTKYIKGQGYK